MSERGEDSAKCYKIITAPLGPATHECRILSARSRVAPLRAKAPRRLRPPTAGAGGSGRQPQRPTLGVLIRDCQAEAATAAAVVEVDALIESGVPTVVKVGRGALDVSNRGGPERAVAPTETGNARTGGYLQGFT